MSSRLRCVRRFAVVLGATLAVGAACVTVPSRPRPAGARPAHTRSSATCSTLAESGDAANPNTVWVGLVTDATRRPLRQLSADLARREIARVGTGLPPTTPDGPRRPLALVACNSALGIDDAFRYLIDSLRLPAVIGPQYSGETLHALQTYTLPAGSVMLATNASAAVFTTLPTLGLFLRMMASDDAQGRVLARLVEERVEPELRDAVVLRRDEPLKVFVSYKGDVYGRGIAATLDRHLRFNGRAAATNGPAFARADHGDPDDGADPVRATDVAREILARLPHVVVIAGSREAQEVIEAVERAWPATAPYRPRWIGSDGVNVIVARMPMPESTFARRLLLTSVRVDFDAPAARQWYATLAREHPDALRADPRSPTALTTYEAVYAMAYAVASLGATPLSGERIAGALRGLNRPGAPPAEIGPSALRDVLARLSAGQPVDLRGASGPLDWDRNGDVEQDIDVLCVRTTRVARDGRPAAGTKPSGLYFDVQRDRFAGTMRDCPGP